MRRGQLRDYFAGVGVKRLSGVDAEPKKSNQHEIGTTRDMRDRFLGAPHEGEVPRVLRLDGPRPGWVRCAGCGHPLRYPCPVTPIAVPEWRLYYPANPVTDAMREGDTLFLAIDQFQAPLLHRCTARLNQ